MASLRNEIIERIERLKGNMSQEDFGKIIGCKQAKVSQLFSRTETKRFTVEELEKIADYFNVSVDSLLGRQEKKKDSDRITPRDFCRMLVDMKDNCGYKIHMKKVTAKEIRAYYYESERECDTTQEPIESNYLALYFTNYDGDGSIYCGEDDHGAPVYDIQPNFERKSSSINTFLEHWQRIRSAYIGGSIDKEDYDTLVSKKLSEVMDE